MYIYKDIDRYRLNSINDILYVLVWKRYSTSQCRVNYVWRIFYLSYTITFRERIYFVFNIRRAGRLKYMGGLTFKLDPNIMNINEKRIP